MTPYFSSHYTIGRSILTIEPPQPKDIEKLKANELPEDRPISVLEIALKHDLEKILLVENTMANYWEAYENAKAAKVKLFFGVQLAIVSDPENKTPESSNEESEIIILFKNKKAYDDIIPLYTAAAVKNFFKVKRTSWKELSQYWTENFILALPFHQSFIAKNLLTYGGCALPDFGKIVPTFFVSDYGLPFDSLIREQIDKWNADHNFPVEEMHKCLYYRKEDYLANLTYRCILDGTTLDKPEQEDFCSNEFSFESYKEKCLTY